MTDTVGGSGDAGGAASPLAEAARDSDERLLYDNRGPVWLEADGLTVRKEYDYGDLANSRYQAEQEFDRLTRFEEALRPIEGVRCPRPLSWREGGASDLPAVRMEWCPGEELFFYLSRPEVSAETMNSIAERMASAIAIYVETFDEPYIDCSFNNAIYDEDSDTLTLIDFGPWWQGQQPGPRIQPLESSLGSVIGTIIRSQLGLSRQRSWKQRKQLIQTASSVIAHAERQLDPESLNRDQMRSRAWGTYRRYTHRGSVLRQVWYRGGGTVLVWLILRGYRRIAL